MDYIKCLYVILGTIIVSSCTLKKTDAGLVTTDSVQVNEEVVVQREILIDSTLLKPADKIVETFKKDTIITKPIKPVVVNTLIESKGVLHQVDKSKQIIALCDSLNGIKELTNNNDGEFINSLIRDTSYPPKSHYCGIFVNYALRKVGIKHNVQEYGRASAWMKDLTKVVFKKGAWLGLDRSVSTGYVVAMSFDKHREISHVGLFIKNLEDMIIIRTFEGNTSNPKNPKQQGLFYKERKGNILWIRKT